MEEKSNFEQKMIVKLSEEDDNIAIANLAYRKAKNAVEQQIKALEGKRIELELRLEERHRALENATFSKDFNLSTYDNAKKAVENVEEEMEDVEKTLVCRKELLETWG